MPHLTRNQLLAAIGGQLTPDEHDGGEHELGQIVTDSREVGTGDVFWALPGSLLDGADFAAEARYRGAAGIVTHRPLDASPTSWTIQVDDSLQSLWRLAKWQRDRFRGRVLAVTGSVGKTTTRLMIDAVLGCCRSGSTSPHNFNNHVGVPLSMLQLAPHDNYAALELAASEPGEIAELAALCRPDVGVITCIGEAHLGSFGSQEQIAQTKTDLLAALPAEGIALLNGDDPWLRKLAYRSQAKVVWVGRGGDCQLAATRVSYADGWLTASVDGLRLEVPIWGRHHLTSALLAVAAGREFGVRSAQIVDALAEFQPPAMRCQVSRMRGAILINDSYNASPLAMRAALELLNSFDQPGRRIVVCGDMRELGPQSDAWHGRLGEEIVTHCGADLLLACGHYAQTVVCSARRAGMPAERAMALQNAEQAAIQLQHTIEPGDVVLVKGSRALAMEQIVEELKKLPLRQAA